MLMKMGRCWMEGAYEHAEIMFSEVGKLEGLIEEGKQFPHAMMDTLAGWYMFSPRICAEDITGAPQVELRGGWWVVTLKIRRGKEMLAAFVNEHERPLVGEHESSEGLCLWCEDCGKRVDLPWDSFGHLGGPLVRDAVATPNEAEGERSGCVLRTVHSSDSGSVPQREVGRAGADSPR